ncbi:MAG: hypothetical protein LQ343_005501 [Gyalolechia ehrenbergii]|nr:MAG: hypothetical protein LQ343_005501 [Gyalolechia ehrenbergii]
MTEKPLNVVIVGGSLTGLFHGVVLKRLGHNVRVLERANPDNLREHGAGIMARDDVQAFLRKHDRFSDQPYFVLGEPKIQFINQNAEVTRTWDMQLYMTSWDTLYHRLRANFDELQSDYVVMGQRAPQIGSGTASYDFGCNVTNVKYNKESVELEVERSTGLLVQDLFAVINGYVSFDWLRQTTSTDLVIAADGPASSIRRLLCPGTERNYVGYIAWRGTVVESQISEKSRGLLRTCLNYFIHSRGHIIIYLIPGKNGSLKPGERLLNYVWYCNYAKDSVELRNLMTDTEGHCHRITMPMDKMRPEVCAQHKLNADRLLPSAFAEVVRATSQPFVQCITEASAPKAVFFDGHLFLAGDAFCTFRPHVASSTNQAALHALLLRRTLTSGTLQLRPHVTHPRFSSKTNQIAMQAYEAQVRQYAKLTGLTSRESDRAVDDINREYHMAETVAAIGLAASIVQLLKFGTEVVGRLQEYRTRSKEIPTVFHDISVQLPLLIADLRVTKERAERTELPSDVAESVSTIVGSCRDHIKVRVA